MKFAAGGRLTLSGHHGLCTGSTSSPPISFLFPTNDNNTVRYDFYGCLSAGSGQCRSRDSELSLAIKRMRMRGKTSTTSRSYPRQSRRRKLVTAIMLRSGVQQVCCFAGWSPFRSDQAHIFVLLHHLRDADQFAGVTSISEHVGQFRSVRVP